MATGIVKWFSSEKGFGFITPDQRVEFGVIQGRKGMQAVNVRPIP